MSEIVKGLKQAVQYSRREGDCAHCGGPKSQRNPTGKCDHLYWPDNLSDEAKIANGYRKVMVEKWTDADPPSDAAW